MQNKAAIPKLFFSLISVSIIICLWILSYYFFSEPNRKNLDYIPNNASIKIRINGKSLIGKSIKNICFDKKDEKLLTQIDTLLHKILRTEVENTGIDFLSEIGVFMINNNQTPNFFITLNLENKEQFSRFASKTNLKNYLIIKSSKVVIIQIDRNKNDEILISQFSTTKNAYRFNDEDFKNDLTVSGKISASSPSFKLNANINKENIILNGKLNQKLTRSNENFTLSKNGFNITINENFLIKKISEFLINISGYKNQITKLETNYRGIALTEDGSPYYAEPDFDLLITYKNKVNQDSVLNFINRYNELGIKYSNQKLTMGNSKYTLEKLDENQLFIGKKRSNILNTKNLYSIEINGSPEFITKINAPEYITSFFEMMTPFAASKSFLTSIKNIKFAVKNKSIETEIKFKKDKNAYQEAVKAFLILKGIQ